MNGARPVRYKRRAPDQPLPAAGEPVRNSFTTQNIYELLCTYVFKNEIVPSSKDDLIKLLTNELNQLQYQIDLNNIHWRRGADLRKRLAVALIELDQVLPRLREEISEANSFAKEDQNLQLQREFLDALEVIETLNRAVRAADQNACLLNPANRTLRAIGWKDFSTELLNSFYAVFPKASKAAGYRFVEKITPTLTGETCSYEAVESHIKKGR